MRHTSCSIRSGTIVLGFREQGAGNRENGNREQVKNPALLNNGMILRVLWNGHLGGMGILVEWASCPLRATT